MALVPERPARVNQRSVCQNCNAGFKKLRLAELALAESIIAVADDPDAGFEEDEFETDLDSSGDREVWVAVCEECGYATLGPVISGSRGSERLLDLQLPGFCQLFAPKDA